MLPNKPKLVPYSYRSFINDDLSLRILRYEDLIDRDTIDLSNKTSDEIADFIFNTFEEYENDIDDDFSHYKLYHLKEFTVREKRTIRHEIGYQYNIYDYTDPDRMIRYWSYEISDWDMNDRIKGIDSRNLTVKLYEFDTVLETYGKTISYVVKLDHIYQLILDLDRIVNWMIDSEIDKIKPNLYVLPIYIYRVRHNENGAIIGPLEFTRISDFMSSETNDYILESLIQILAGLYRFATLNYKMVLSEEQSDVFEKVDETPDEPQHHYIKENDEDEEPRPRRKYKTDTKYTYVDLGDGISLRMKASNSNKYHSGTHHTHHAQSDYVVQVGAHYRRYICGSGDNRHYELRRIEPFIRNMKGSAKSVKVFSEGE